MTATAPAASNGSTTTDSTPAERERGLAGLREEECYHLTGLIRNALNAAERLNGEVYDLAADRYTDWRGEKGTKPLDRGHVITKLTEARDCAQVAIDYLYRAINALRDRHDEPEPF